MGDWFGNERDRVMIERELRILANVRTAYREHGYVLPSINPIDALLDELLDLGSAEHVATFGALSASLAAAPEIAGVSSPKSG
jgi:hypothetical protein